MEKIITMEAMMLLTPPPVPPPVLPMLLLVILGVDVVFMLCFLRITKDLLRPWIISKSIKIR